MKIAHFTPGSGHFHCGSCLRDKSLVDALRRRGHDVSIVPLYLPFVLEDETPVQHEPIRMGGVNMYLQQKMRAARWLPRPVARWLDSPRLLRWLSSRSSMTDASHLGPLTVSMLRGETGRQVHEVDKLITWMKTVECPDVIALSNLMLVGLVRRLKAELGCAVVCTLQGEAPFLDTLPPSHRSEAWKVIAERAREVDAFIPVSASYGDVMAERASLDRTAMHVVHNGIDLDDLVSSPVASRSAPVIGFLARMCPDKGLDTLVEAYIRLRNETQFSDLRLHIGGASIAADEPFISGLQRRLREAGVEQDVAFHRNLSRAEKIEFLRGLQVLSVPATYGESFGLFVLEALAVGVPVVQPRHGAFPEIIEATEGGILCAPDDAGALAAGLAELLTDSTKAATLAARGRERVRERFTADDMARGFENVCMMVVDQHTRTK